jgi:hypothetical protein
MGNIMNLEEAQKLVENEVLGKHQGCGLLTEATLEYEKCFVFFYQSLKYIETRDMMDSVVGHGPVFVDKSSGRVFETGSAYSLEQYLASFNLTGDPYGHIPSCEELGLGCTVEISGYAENHSVLEAIMNLKRIMGKGASEIKPTIDSVLEGQVVQFELPDGDCAMQVVDALNESGFQAELLWNANRKPESVD